MWTWVSGFLETIVSANLPVRCAGCLESVALPNEGGGWCNAKSWTAMTMDRQVLAHGNEFIPAWWTLWPNYSCDSCQFSYEVNRDLRTVHVLVYPEVLHG
jgi:hypothetical protein